MPGGTNFCNYFFEFYYTMQLSEIIQQRIKNEGPISFRDYMEMALYYPGLGYYTSNKEKIGKNGDFYTSVNVTPAFGAMIGRQLEEMWTIMGKKEFTVVEFGAGTGALCKDVFTFLKKNSALYENLQYCIVEKSPAMREKEQMLLGNIFTEEIANEKIKWYDHISKIKNITGCILSNELVDNFACHQVVMRHELMEVFIDYQKDFIEVLRPAGKELKDYFSELRVELPKGFRTEINLEATNWIKEIAQSLKQGYVITIDYGYPSSELYNEYRNNGTLKCYHKHRTNEQPYTAIGEQDITAHVNFSALCLWGYKNGLEYCGYRKQGDFLLALGFTEYLKNSGKQEQHYLNYERDALVKHTLISDMGSKFSVLIQQKQINKQELMGLKPLQEV